MQSVLINGAHFIAAAAGFLLIHFLSTRPNLQKLMLPAAGILGAAVAAFIFWRSEPTPAFRDFIEAYWKTGNAVATRGAQGLIDSYNDPILVFVNIPIVAWLFAPFGMLPSTVAALIHLAIGALLVAWIWRALVRMFALDDRSAALFLFALCVFGPLVYSLREGNTSHHILALLVGGWLAFRADRQVLAGVLFAIAAVIKPALLLVGVYYFLRGKWGVVLGGAAVIAVTVGASLLAFGWDMHVLWYEQRIVPYSEGPTTAFVNQSIPAFIARFEAAGLGPISDAAFDPKPHALGMLGKLASYGLIGFLVLAVGAALFASGRPFKPSQRDMDIELWLVVLFAALASPVSWAHYYVWLIPGFLMAWTLVRSEGSTWLRWPIIGAFALTAPIAFISQQMVWGSYGPASNLLLSHTVAGASVMVLVLALLRARRA